MAKAVTTEKSNRRQYWADQIAKAQKQYSPFIASGRTVVDKYRIQKTNETNAVLGKNGQDRYNILYSSTETIKPSLYAQTPKVEAKPRHRDRKNPTVRAANQLIETAVTYAIEEVDFDGVMANVIEDYSLPGQGLAWWRYSPTFKDATDSTGAPVYESDGKTPVQVKDMEALELDYIYWEDVLFGFCRTFKELPWGAKRVYFDKPAFIKRWGKELAAQVSFTAQKTDRRNDENDEAKQCVIWEIWDKKNGKVIWYCESYADELLEEIDDPLHLKGFFPFPRPIRAISNTRTFVPRCFYSQYQAQAEEVDNLTGRIRHLTNALVVRGVYDGSMDKLSQLLAPTGGNKMIAVDNWQQFVSNGGMVGSVQWVPIRDIAEVLMKLIQARDIAKAEIYEITGFSDIVRGVSKASETLGAQEIKNDWASARLKQMQKEVQRFCRDLVRIAAEIICEHFSDESLALYAGFDAGYAIPAQPGVGHNGGPPLEALPPPQVPGTAPPAPEMPPQGLPQPPAPQMAPGAPPMAAPAPVDPMVQAAIEFKKVVKLLRDERERCANIGIETDSTILPDEAAERKDRMEFLSAIGAFLQQAGPMVMQFPEMRGLLGGIMMFTVRTFRASRPMEQEFERFQEMLDNMPPTPPPGKDDGKAAAAAAQVQMQIAQLQASVEKEIATMKLQSEGAKVQADNQVDMLKENNRHTEAMAELDLRMQEVQLEVRKLELEERIATHEAQVQEAELRQQEQAAAHAQNMDEAGLNRDLANDAHGQQMDVANHEQKGEIAAKNAAKPATAKGPKNDA